MKAELESRWDFDCGFITVVEVTVRELKQTIERVTV